MTQRQLAEKCDEPGCLNISQSYEWLPLLAAAEPASRAAAATYESANGQMTVTSQVSGFPAIILLLLFDATASTRRGGRRQHAPSVGCLWADHQTPKGTRSVHPCLQDSHGCGMQTHKHTDHATSVATGHIYALRACDAP